MSLRDETETLRLARTLIQGLDATCATTETTDSVPRRIHLSDSVKSELEYLRDKIRELQVRRDQLHAEYSERMERTAVWEQLANRQNQQRYAAELENLKLRVILDTQLQMGKDLMRMLEHQAPQLVPSGPHFYISFPHVLSLSRAEQTVCVDKLYEQRHDVFASFPDGLTTSVREMSVEQDAKGGITVETRMGWMLPFAVDRVVDVVRHITRSQLEGRGHLTDDGDLLFVEYDASKIHAISVAGWHLTKRYAAHDDDPATFVSQASAKCFKRPKGTEQTVEIDYQDESWVRLVASVVSGQAMTRIEVVRRDRSGYESDEASAHNAVIGTITDHLLAFIDMELTRAQQCIENLLFASSRGDN
ncbi:hypothetical protein Poli38472_007248 [Pythium oligandrum]|uniref:Uncharacterized protein n=1 Tax=Pythium oligandrum TaxID=41045 RepID=A0A8K1C9W1_PYTOL|nr:hypothetical protein Poli38472_007248 [Pythium oligandrum]|eukprot:TMW59103.1 hypothetical protein Poli38472_007248 [Pythium oligandrum]